MSTADDSDIFKTLDTIDTLLRSKDRAEALAAEARDSRAECQRMRCELEDATRERDRLRLALGDIQARVSNVVVCAEENEGLRRSLRECQLSLEGSMAEAKVLQQQLADAKTLLQVSRDAEARVSSQLEGASAELITIRDALGKATNELRSEREENEVSIEALKRKLAMLEKEHEQELQAIRLSLHEEATMAVSGLQAEMSVSQELRVMLEKSQEEVKGLKEQLKSVAHPARPVQAEQENTPPQQRAQVRKATPYPSQKKRLELSSQKGLSAKKVTSFAACQTPMSGQSRLSTLFSGVPPPDSS